MTLRTIENEFAEILLTQTEEEFPHDLTLDGPIMTRIHPKVILAKLHFDHNSQQDPEAMTIPGWFYDAFADIESAQKKYPHIQLQFLGKPWSMHEFLKSDRDEAIIDFPEIGVIVLSKKEIHPSGRELHNYLAPVWLNYALSPELWGPVGKWTRFHQRLHDLFSKYDLLNGEDHLGYYPLKANGEILFARGFQGTNLDKTYLLVLPWSFSQTSLKKLEEVVLEEF